MTDRRLAALSHVTLVSSFLIGRIKAEVNTDSLEGVNANMAKWQHAHREGQCSAD
jgi:hypothetical protein